ncbi:MAG: HNH endonuclease [Acidimicrobiia bacterium]|nr:HNH endonuclease [Acidimicrobiia bacterium]NNL27069.1 DUF222 domain-containing protein [Acidimicrobiia bacterium]
MAHRERETGSVMIASRGDRLAHDVPAGDDRVDVDPMEQIRAGVARLQDEDRRQWLPRELTARLRDLATARERLEAEYVRLIADWDRRQAWAVDGSLSPSAWLAHHTPVSSPAAKKSVRTARLVRTHESTSEALAAGAVSVTQIEQLARAEGRGRGEIFTEHEETLLDAASLMNEDDFGVVVKRWQSMADDQLGRADARHMFENRYLYLSTTFAGAVAVDGLLDPEAGARLQAALEARVTPDPADDPEPRSAAQLRADALIDLVEEAATGTTSARPSRVRTSVNVVVDLPTLQGDEWTPRSRADLVGIGPVARETVARLLCDSYLTRVITAGPSQVLDVGRSTRFVSEPQRAALVVRDETCVFPSCSRDHRWCDAHHLTFYEHDPRTDLENLVLLCRRHHAMVHEGLWTMKRDCDSGHIITGRGPPR